MTRTSSANVLDPDTFERITKEEYVKRCADRAKLTEFKWPVEQPLSKIVENIIKEKTMNIFDYVEKINLMSVNEVSIDKINKILDDYRDNPKEELYQESKNLKPQIDKEISDYDVVIKQINELKENLIKDEDIAEEEKKNFIVIAESMEARFRLSQGGSKEKLNIILNLMMNHRMKMLVTENRKPKTKPFYENNLFGIFSLIILFGFLIFTGVLLWPEHMIMAIIQIGISVIIGIGSISALVSENEPEKK